MSEGLTPDEKAKVIALIRLKTDEQIEWLKINSKKEWTEREFDAYKAGATFGCLKTLGFVTKVQR